MTAARAMPKAPSVTACIRRVEAADDHGGEHKASQMQLSMGASLYGQRGGANLNCPGARGGENFGLLAAAAEGCQGFGRDGPAENWGCSLEAGELALMLMR